jgi:hypothetical protein
VAALIALASFSIFVLTPGQPAPTHGSATTGTSHTTALHHKTPAAAHDPQATAIRQLARSLAEGGLPGDAPLASSLDATASAQAGAARETAAATTLALAGVLYAGGGISGTQFQDVASVLQTTGATVPTTTVPTTPPAPNGDQGPGHHHGGDGNLGNSGFSGNS